MEPSERDSKLATPSSWCATREICDNTGWKESHDITCRGSPSKPRCIKHALAPTSVMMAVLSTCSRLITASLNGLDICLSSTAQPSPPPSTALSLPSSGSPDKVLASSSSVSSA